MVGISVIIFLFIPESPWWLVSKGRNEQAAKVLQRYFGKIPGYNVQEKIVSVPISSFATSIV
jgi:MFS transporter, SP family, general alpha glucoside:H+ symporter